MTTLTNQDTTLEVLKLGVKKASYSAKKTFVLGFMGGLYIALAALGNLLAMQYIGGGLGRFIGACIFPTGLMLVVLVGGSLFTGDALGFLAVCEKETKAKTFFKNLSCVWLGNFAGAVFLAVVCFYGASFADKAFADMTLHLVEHKLSLSPLTAVCSGFLCNVLVAIGVWFALATPDMNGKILAIFFPIMLFVFAGFQHVVANMFYINMGILLNPALFDISTYTSHFIWVTIGNFISGSLFLPLIYKSLYIHK